MRHLFVCSYEGYDNHRNDNGKSVSLNLRVPCSWSLPLQQYEAVIDIKKEVYLGKTLDNLLLMGIYRYVESQLNVNEIQNCDMIKGNESDVAIY